MRWRGTITHASMEKPIQVFARTLVEIINIMQAHAKSVPPDALVRIIEIQEIGYIRDTAENFMRRK